MIEMEIHFKLEMKHKLLAEYNSKHNHLRLYKKRWWLTTKQGTQITVIVAVSAFYSN